ncbi:hypothetical protein CRUP_013843, partial [Coryphaenoides rupestris]
MSTLPFASAPLVGQQPLFEVVSPAPHIGARRPSAGDHAFRQIALWCAVAAAAAVESDWKEVGFGETVSYQRLAQMAGNPRAARAVGGAMRRNPREEEEEEGEGGGAGVNLSVTSR